MFYTLEYEEADWRIQEHELARMGSSQPPSTDGERASSAPRASRAASAASDDGSVIEVQTSAPTPMPNGVAAHTGRSRMKHFWTAIEGAVAEGAPVSTREVKTVRGDHFSDRMCAYFVRVQLLASLKTSVKSKWDDPTKLHQGELYDRLEFVRRRHSRQPTPLTFPSPSRRSSTA